MKKYPKLIKIFSYTIFIAGMLFLLVVLWQIPAVQNKALEVKIVKRYYSAYQFYKMSLTYPAGSNERNKFETIARAYFLGQSSFSLGTSVAPPIMGQ